jgi:hypothetical protein
MRRPGARMKIVPSVHDRRLASDRRRGGSSIWASWMRQVDMVTAAEVWELVHEQRIPVKQTAGRLGAPISTLYEFLAAGKAARDNASHRAAALLSAAAKSPPLEDDDVIRARAARLLDQGLPTKVVCVRLGRTEGGLRSGVGPAQAPSSRNSGDQNAPIDETNSLRPIGILAWRQLAGCRP